MFREYNLGKKNCLLSLNCFFDAGLARLDKGGWQAGSKTTVIYRDTRACVNFEQTAVQWQLLREKRNHFDSFVTGLNIKDYFKTFLCFVKVE